MSECLRDDAGVPFARMMSGQYETVVLPELSVHLAVFQESAVLDASHTTPADLLGGVRVERSINVYPAVTWETRCRVEYRFQALCPPEVAQENESAARAAGVFGLVCCMTRRAGYGLDVS